jgi:hypothetical protein
MQGDYRAAEQFGEIRDLFHLLGPGRPRFRRHQSDRAADSRDVRVAFAFEPAEHRGQRDSQIAQPLQEPFRVFGGPRLSRRRVQLDGGHAQFVSHFELHAQTGVDAGKHTQRPFFHDRPLLYFGSKK